MSILKTLSARTTIYPKWRLLALHLIAKALGVLIHVDDMPYGSSRIYRTSPEGSENSEIEWLTAESSAALFVPQSPGKGSA